MNRLTVAMLLRSIRNSIGRFLAILAIVALGVGFFAGLKSSQPAMLHSVDEYFREQNMYDFRLLSSLGFTEEDVRAFRELADIAAAEGSCFADAYAVPEGGTEEVLHFQTLTEQVAIPLLSAGRMPLNAGECLADDALLSEKDLGKTITVSASNSDETLEHFVFRRYTVVGLARSPLYISTDRGSSDLGAGRPAGFILIPSGAFTDKIFHELFLRCDLPGELYSEEYDNARRHLRPAVEALLNIRGTLRYEDLRSDTSDEIEKARRDLEDGWRTYRLEKRKSERELNSALQTLTVAQEQLDSGRTSLLESEWTLGVTERNLAKQKDDLSLRKQQLAIDRAELEAAESGRTELISRRAALQAAQLAAELDRSSALGPYSSALAAAYAQLMYLQGQEDLGDFSFLETILDALEIDPLEAAKQAVEDAQAALDKATAEYDESHREEVNARENEINEINAALDALDTRSAELDAEESAIEAEELQLSLTEAALPDSRQQLDQSWKTLAESERELMAGWAEYNSGKEKAEKELAAALAELEDGERALKEAQEALNNALQLDLYTLDRNTNAGYVTFENDSAIVDGVAVVFPFFFSLVAALVCSTTMTRMVSEERTQIGTMKALGYSSGTIMAKYLIYAGLSALVGCVAGFFLGATALPYLVWYAYNIMYRYTGLRFLYSGGMFAGCLLTSVPGILFVTWLACRSALLEKPADLIRPKAPAVGRRVLLERIPFIWKHLPFIGKLSIRNAFRYPARFLMMILGISGCAALMVAGFGIKDSIARVADYQYGEISLFDLSVTLDENQTEEIERLWTDWTGASSLVRKQSISLAANGIEKESELITGDPASLSTVFSLHEKNGPVLPWPGSGELIITKRLSDDLSLRKGDSVTVILENGSNKNLTVSGICEYYVGHAVFASPEDFPAVPPNCALLRLQEGDDAGRRAAALRTEEAVIYVNVTQSERETIETSMASLDLLVLMLVFSSGALAFITLYNLTNINIMERVREVATVKVLGFTSYETAQYILTENMLLSVLGAFAGLLLGRLLHRFVLDMIHLESMSFDIRITPVSYLISFALTLFFAAMINLLMRGKLEHVKMAESLKSVE